MKVPTLAPANRKDHLVQTALELFYKEGFHATGIDKILRESGVAKMTLYKYFRSKEELIVAVLEERDRQFRDWFSRELDQRATDPQDKLLALFDVLELWFGGDFRGCMFINAAAEFAELNEDIHRLAGEHKRHMLQYLTVLAEAAGAGDAETLAFQLNLLMEGAIVMAHVCKDVSSAQRARVAARVLIASALG